MPSFSLVERSSFDYARADWSAITSRIAQVDWATVLRGKDADSMLHLLCQTALQALQAHTPIRRIFEQKSTHLWINNRCRDLILAKWTSFGTDEFENIQRRCSKALRDAYSSHMALQRDKLLKLKHSSNKWWNTAKTLMCKSNAINTIPPLVSKDGIWAVKSKAKADLLADVSLNKASLPPAVANETPMLSPVGQSQMSGFLPVRLRNVAAELRRLGEDSSTGPDGISTRVLKRCAKAIAPPLTLLMREILDRGSWPRSWRTHRLIPLHKKKERSNPANYRLIHITAQMSKVAERVLGRLFLPYLRKTGAYGTNQFAYTHGTGLQDALALNSLRWIRALSFGRRVGLYCSDVSGAFDRVPSDKLAETLSQRGVHPKLLALLKSWLEPRSAIVVVDGEQSQQRLLSNSVYQGTVWGPPLWNTFFADTDVPLHELGFSETKFADDLNAYKEYAPTVTDHIILDELQECQVRLHTWGMLKQIQFDGSKESFHILSRSDPYGDPFKFLGVTFDTKLTMRNACMEIAAQGHSRVRTILRLRPYYSTAQVVGFYRNQVLSYLEVFTAAVHHANEYFLNSIDQVQAMFLEELGVTEEEAVRFSPRAAACASGHRDPRVSPQNGFGTCTRFSIELVPAGLFAFSTEFALTRRQACQPAS